ncbi:MAG TPA: hypothetical protein VMT91_13810 [Anaerolineales bacterium]|nr:hypothetical protein [Anaerolineales bacterium]
MNNSGSGVSNGKGVEFLGMWAAQPPTSKNSEFIPLKTEEPLKCIASAHYINATIKRWLDLDESAWQRSRGVITLA